MKKRLTVIFTALCLFCMLVIPSASAADSSAIQTAQALGILTVDSSGNLNLGAEVTRADFARMLVKASTYRDSVSGVNGSMFRDVNSEYWAAPYIRIVVQQGWMSGYSDNSFRPDNTVTLEEACSSILRMMGYKATDMPGAYPDAQLNKASEIGLRKQLLRNPGEKITREDCAYLFYNALSSKTSSGASYAASIGYTVASSGEVDFSSALASRLKGPYVAEEGTTLPFTPYIIYRNGAVSTSAELNRYDVYYYNESVNTVWIYTRRASGKVSSLSPNSKSPTSVTVAGVSYNIGTSGAAYQLSVLSGGGVGRVVTLLLGMDNEVVGVVTDGDVATQYYGVVKSSSRSLETAGDASVQQSVTVTCTDGIVRTFVIPDDTAAGEGWLVSVKITDQGVDMEALSNTITGTWLSGKVGEDGMMIGDYQLATNVKILDSASDGNAVAIQPKRLAGCTLNPQDVRFYSLDENGKVEHLILNDVTGDTWTYGFLSKVTKVSTGSVSDENIIDGIVQSVVKGEFVSYLWDIATGADTTVYTNLVQNNLQKLYAELYGNLQSAGVPKILLNVVDYFVGGAVSGAQYTYLVNGTPTSSTTNIRYPVIAGGIAVRYAGDGKTVRSMLQVAPSSVQSVKGRTLQCAAGEYALADDVQVYLYKYGNYYSVLLSDVNPDDYTMTAWVDIFSGAAGNKVRIITATKKD